MSRRACIAGGAATPFDYPMHITPEAMAANCIVETHHDIPDLTLGAFNSWSTRISQCILTSGFGQKGFEILQMYGVDSVSSWRSGLDITLEPNRYGFFQYMPLSCDSTYAFLAEPSSPKPAT